MVSSMRLSGGSDACAEISAQIGAPSHWFTLNLLWSKFVVDTVAANVRNKTARQEQTGEPTNKSGAR